MKMKINVSDFISKVFEGAKIAIAKYEEYKNFSNEEKKARVDDYVTNLVATELFCLDGAPIFKFIVKHFIIPYIPVLTQKVFDMIKTKIEGITK